MEFEEKMKEFIERVKKVKKSITTEEATKTSLIMPFFSLLGYDVFNPAEFIPEFVADVGIKKGEKVDYAITLNGEVVIVIEAKSVNEKLEKHESQLIRYFGVTSAKLAILTNGINYKFFTDLEEPIKMDEIPFLDINFLEIKDTDINELKKFCKENFDITTILNTASNLKYIISVEKVLTEELSNPSDEFVRLILSKGVYDNDKRTTQNVINKYKPILKKAITYYINSLINQRLQNALNSTSSDNTTESLEDIENSSDIITTAEEIESYYIVKSILSEYVEPNKIAYKDTASYFGIMYDNKVTKWICRIFLRENVSFVIIPDEEKKEIRYELTSINDLYKLKDKLIARLNVLTK